MAAQRYRARQPAPAPAVDEHSQLVAAERRDPLTRQRLAPSAEQLAERESHALADEHDAGGGEGDERAEQRACTTWPSCSVRGARVPISAGTITTSFCAKTST